MHLIKRSLKILPLALVAASLAPPPAAAAEPATATCTFTGLSGTFVPPVRPLPQTGGGGGFAFQGRATCHLTHDARVALNVSATINASGTYSNIGCGTGTAAGQAAIAFVANHTGILNAWAGFTITSAAANAGALTITYFDDNLGHSGQGGGEVTVIPTQGSCTAGGVSAFTMAGGFAVEGTH